LAGFRPNCVEGAAFAVSELCNELQLHHHTSHQQRNIAHDLRAKLLEVIFDHPASRDIQFAVLADLAMIAHGVQFGGDENEVAPDCLFTGLPPSSAS
jgi:hypothetical protein